MNTHIHIHVYTNLYTDIKSQQRRLKASNNIIDALTHPYTYACIHTYKCIYLEVVVPPPFNEIRSTRNDG